MKKLILIPMLVLAACATNPNKAVELDTKVEKITVISETAVIGVKEGNMVYQKKVLIGEELRSLQNKAYEAEAHLYGGSRYYDNNGMIGSLKECRAKLSALEDGKLKWTEKRDYVIPEYETLKIGVDESGKLAAITEEYLKERIERFKGYKSVIDQRTEEMQEKISSCQAQVSFGKRTVAVQGE